MTDAQLHSPTHLGTLHIGLGKKFNRRSYSSGMYKDVASGDKCGV